MRIAGIDLGTTNSALATYDQDAGRVSVLGVEQVIGPGRIAASTTLPSYYYFLHESDGDPSQFGINPDSVAGIAGRYAKERGAQVPDRLVSSAKSWLCHRHVNRNEKFLPWKSESVTTRLSPVEVSTRYLVHLKQSFLRTTGADEADTSWVVTVPASFDEVARQLTVKAADDAGLKNLTLLEEPLAAFYAWIAATPDYPKEIKPGEHILVCDVGGGTTDFTLIAVGESHGQIDLSRVSVGDHLLLGGDNMDLALAVRARAELEATGKTVDHWQFLSLIAQVRDAKERLLCDDADLDEVQVSVASRGSSLFASTVSVPVRKADVEHLIVNGFFPDVSLNDPVVAGRSGGLHEIGLHYESEPAITRHLVRFLTRGESTTVRPSAVLFNGGVFKSRVLRDRMMDVLRTCTNNPDLRLLQAADLDLAVAKGAAYYGQLKQSGKGVRVRAGVARNFYIGVDSNMPAVPGYTPPVMGLCIVPKGADEGTAVALPDRRFSLVVGQPVQFRFFSSGTRSSDQPGQIVGDAVRELEETDPLFSQMAADGRRAGEFVTVTMHAVVTETGTLVVTLKDTESAASWNLEFNVRES
jgi:molecular chaperone DnaK (HSP70)